MYEEDFYQEQESDFDSFLRSVGAGIREATGIYRDVSNADQIPSPPIKPKSNDGMILLVGGLVLLLLFAE